MELVYYLAPAIAHEVSEELATIILEYFTSTDASAELHKHCGSTNGTPMLAVDNFNSESISQCPIPQPVGAVSAIDIDAADDGFASDYDNFIFSHRSRIRANTTRSCGHERRASAHG